MHYKDQPVNALQRSALPIQNEPWAAICGQIELAQSEILSHGDPHDSTRSEIRLLGQEKYKIVFA